MEDYRFTKTPKILTIGDFHISCRKLSSRMRGQIPFSGMAFYHPEQRKEDFCFWMDEKDLDGDKKLLWGSSEFAVPTFLYQRQTGDYDWITWKKDRTPGLIFRISSHWSQFTLCRDETGTDGERAFREFGSLFSYAVLNHKACVLHGVVMEYKGIGILVTASSGTGKTTHTRMWRDEERALILNGDRCLCREMDGRWYAYGMPWAGSSGEYINRRVPIAAVVSLKRDTKNHTRILSHFEGSIYLMQRIFAPMWRCQMQEEAISMAEKLAKEFPVIELSCRPDLESVQTLKETLESQGVYGV